ncbi:MAG TPA: MBL fold metallo-hydrolase [Pseudolabrys sp.]|jgi:glyoxylase-like metal-dependent hydrolase (beta-lactamase superfamily II)|nr:MBL fold metallo-hydrolase [Pseudolabrys sp.]
MRALWSIAALAALLMLAQPLAAQTPADPIVKTEGLRQVSPHVYIIPDNSVPLVPNVGFVIGERGILVIDTGLGPRNGSAVLEVAKELGGSRALYLVTTHFHPEHDLGAQVFPESTTLIRSNDEAKDIAEFGLQLAQVFARRSAINAELLKDADFRKANVTFDRDYALDLGGVKVQLIAMGANHTRGDTAIWVESDRVLFSGDVAMRAQPAFASPYSTIRQWLSSLDKLEALKPAVIVPSHGPTGDAAFISGYRNYLIEVRDRTAADKKAGRNADQTTETVTAAMAERFPDKGRLAGAIKAAYAEAQ